MDNDYTMFFTELEQLLRKHNISISHEDKQGAFIIEDFSENNMNWLKEALINKEEIQRKGGFHKSKNYNVNELETSEVQDINQLYPINHKWED